MPSQPSPEFLQLVQQEQRNFVRVPGLIVPTYESRPVEKLPVLDPHLSISFHQDAAVAAQVTGKANIPRDAILGREQEKAIGWYVRFLVMSEQEPLPTLQGVVLTPIGRVKRTSEVNLHDVRTDRTVVGDNAKKRLLRDSNKPSELPINEETYHSELRHLARFVVMRGLGEGLLASFSTRSRK